MTTIIGLTGKAKETQKNLLSEMDKNYKEKQKGWKNENAKLACKIAQLFGREAYDKEIG